MERHLEGAIGATMINLENAGFDNVLETMLKKYNCESAAALAARVWSCPGLGIYSAPEQYVDTRIDNIKTLTVNVNLVVSRILEDRVNAGTTTDEEAKRFAVGQLGDCLRPLLDLCSVNGWTR